MDKVYNHQEFEEKIYSLWEKSGAFTPQIQKDKKPFTIIMPPPNANADLHVGHVRFVTIEDILTRYHRMRGDPTLWLPSSDHAGIETQFLFEKKLRTEGKSRSDFDRKTLYKMIWDYVQNNKINMEKQLRALGSSCDWSRNKFTLDPQVIKIVYQTFKKLYDEGLVYRGERIINYCPRCGTAYSQLEVNSVERDDQLYYLDYGILTIATTRPETIFADVAVAVNPGDTKYKKIICQTATLPLVNRELPIIIDSLVDKNFGTGALKITPGHDPVDFEIGQKHKLQIISVIDESGRMINTPNKYVGLKVEEARVEVVKDLQKAGKIKKVEPLHHVVGICYKDKGLIEPTVSKQWFIKVAPLAKHALSAMKEKKVFFVSEKYGKIARHWLKNLKDWNISRQIVWGIQIPAWRCNKCLEWTITDVKAPKKCKKCNSDKLTQDTDTFDTWFSSGQWPFATLRTSPYENDFEYFYPTSVMETAYEIIPFWVIRMIMLGLYVTGKVPFKEVLIHGLIRDKFGQKISKSKGNVINPLEMSQKYGADALRMSVVWGALIETDICLSEENIIGQRNFANKLWNIARFVLASGSNPTSLNLHAGKAGLRGASEDDKWIREELKNTVKKMTRLLDKYRISEAAEEIYDFIWHKFADQYLERVKSRREEAQPTLDLILNYSLRLLHPFMPFVTEAIWSLGFAQNKQDLLIQASWPKA